MLLAIDSGNTNVVFALMDGNHIDDNHIHAQWRIETNDRRTADEYFVWLTQLAAAKGLHLKGLRGVIMANVRPASQFALERLSKEHLGHVPHVAGTAACPIDLAVKIDRPDQVGADRLVNAFAAKQMGLKPAILIDTGTATTFDILDQHGAYVGGIIAPGVHVSATALAQAAAQLPLVSVEQPPSPIGTDTKTAMQSGLFWGYVDMLDGLIMRTKTAMVAQGHAAQMDHIQVIGTGGLMKVLSKGLKNLDRLEGDLTLVGLSQIYNQNK